jgi:hypothetical protein
MSAISLRLPASLHEVARKVAHKDHVSINHFITIALAEKISALMAKDYLTARANKGSRKAFEKVMAKVPNVEPPEYDKL